MGRAREEMHEHEEQADTLRLLGVMIYMLHDNPTASIPELYKKACAHKQAMEEEVELTRKMEKDD